MHRLSAVLAITLLCAGAATAAAMETELHLGRFSNNDMGIWKEQTLGFFKTKTSYTLTRAGDKTVLMAQSRGSASGLIYKLNMETRERPVLKWSWKVERTLRRGDERTKDGDDYPARIYAIFPRGLFSRMRAVSYVWANKLPKGEHIVSPYTSNVMTIAVDTGDELAGRWTFHQRNVYEDYRTLFHEEPPRLGAVAILTDTDNTGDTVTAWYGDIFLAPVGKAPEPHERETTREQRGAEARTPHPAGSRPPVSPAPPALP